MSSRRSIIAVAIMSTSVLSACGASSPPAKELAVEMVDTLDHLSDGVKACMRQRIENFTLTEEQALGFTDLDDVAAKAAEDNAAAKRILDEFRLALASCR